MRGTGKSTLLKNTFSGEAVHWIDLLLMDEEMKYRKSPDALVHEIRGLIKIGKKPAAVVIDEVQKLPALLDAVHYLIENEKITFALTGSSARKLKRGSANLLAGRAMVFKLFPLSHQELAGDFDLNSYLSWGGLPALYAPEFSDTSDKIRFLRAYVQTYLKEEIMIEQLVRKIDPFHSFLEVSGQMNGEIMNFSKTAHAAGTNDKTVERYYAILEDTLLGFHLMPFHESIRRQQVGSSKFYYYDTGIVRCLRGFDGPVVPSTYEYGRLFESFIIGEIVKRNHYRETDYRLSYLKTKDGVEIDLIVQKGSKKRYCVEIKSGAVHDLNEFNAAFKLSRDIDGSEFLVLSQNPAPLSNDRIHVMPWQQGIEYLFPEP